jgi:outer membrane protein assembly factor BamD
MQIKSLKLFGLMLLVLFSMALSACGSLSEDDETRTWPATKLYAEAKTNLEDNNYVQAIEYLQKLESRFPFGVYAQQAKMDLAYAYYKINDPENQVLALSTIDGFVKLYPKHANLDYMLYLRGLVTFNVGFFDKIAGQDLTERDPKGSRDSFDAFKQLVTQFPDSKYSADAIARMKYLANTLAQYDVHVARYYYQRGAYLAAVNRAQAAITEYPDTPVIEDALYIMTIGYEALGMNDLRDDAKRVFAKNFPNSEYLKGKTLAKRTWWKVWQ